MAGQSRGGRGWHGRLGAGGGRGVQNYGKTENSKTFGIHGKPSGRISN